MAMSHLQRPPLPKFRPLGSVVFTLSLKATASAEAIFLIYERDDAALGASAGRLRVSAKSPGAAVPPMAATIGQFRSASRLRCFDAYDPLLTKLTAKPFALIDFSDGQAHSNPSTELTGPR